MCVCGLQPSISHFLYPWYDQPPAEYARRLDTFARNLARAQRLQDMGIAQFGVTPFSDLTGAGPSWVLGVV